jgi:tetratricopeptide (TPR) repeat protein
VAPQAVAGYETLGMIYRDLSLYSSDSRSLAIAAFTEATKLEPANPVIAAELGKLYLADDRTEEAILWLGKSLALKENYFEAEFNLAKAYIQAEQEAEALEILNELASQRQSADIFYEQGRAYFNQDNFAAAINSFSQVLGLSPVHANAMYSLALAHEAIGNPDEALYFLKKVLKLNPDSKEVVEKIEELEEE